MPETRPVSAQELLDQAATTASCGSDEVLGIARAAVMLTYHTDRPDVVLKLSEQIQQDTYELQRRLRALEDLVVQLGAQRPGEPTLRDRLDLPYLNTPASIKMLDALAGVAIAAGEVDKERGWVDEEGRPMGYYQRYAADHVVLRAEVLGPQGRE